MLVLSRKVGEKLVIGGNITVVINRVAGNRVTIGIEAPDDVRIVRGEINDESRPKTEVPNRNFDSRDATSASTPSLAK